MATVKLPSGKVILGNERVLTPWFPEAGSSPVNEAIYNPRNAGKTRQVQEFLHIRYAKAPVGDLRWKAAVSVLEPEEPIYDARRYRTVPWHQPTEPQELVVGRDPDWINYFLFKQAMGIDYNEDCLFINVWTPTLDPNAKLPVAAWIHGGKFMRNTVTSPVFDGARLATKGLCVVSIEYRLTAFGHFHHAAFNGESGFQGSYALTDQRAAFAWIQHNILSFGGDPGNVTPFGDSAGAASVQEHLLADWPEGRPFHKAMSWSGGGFGPSQSMAAVADAAADFWALADKHVPAYNPTGKALYKGLTLAQLDAAHGRAVALRHGVWPFQIMDYYGFRQRYRFSAAGGTYFKPELSNYPIYDGALVKYSSRVLGFAAGVSADVPLLIGGNTRESSVFGDDVPFANSILGFTTRLGIASWPDLEQLRGIMRASGDKDDVFGENVVGDSTFLWPARMLARYQDMHKVQPAFMFNWGYVSAGNAGAFQAHPGRANHGSGVVDVFNTLNWGVGFTGHRTLKMRHQDIRTSDAWMEYFRGFCYTGTPSVLPTKYELDFDLFAPADALAMPAAQAYDAALDNVLVLTNGTNNVTTVNYVNNFRRNIFEYYRTKAGLA